MGFDIDFKGVTNLANQIGELGDVVLKQAVDNAFTASKNYLNSEIEKLMDQSIYNFNRGQGYSKGKAKASFEVVRNMPVLWTGNTAEAFIGVKLRDALEFQFIIWGTPHMAPDLKLQNAVKVKGNYAKEVSRIQQEQFNKVIKEALNNG